MDEILYRKGCENLTFKPALLEGIQIVSLETGGSVPEVRRSFFQPSSQQNASVLGKDEVRLSEWLQVQRSIKPNGQQDANKPTPHLKLLISRWPKLTERGVARSQIRLAEETYKDVLTRMNLPLSLPYHHTTAMYAAIGFHSNGKTGSSESVLTAIFQTPARYGSFFSLAISYDVIDKQTNAYLVATESAFLDQILERLESAAIQATHPLLLPILLYMTFIEIFHSSNNSILEGVRQIQANVGVMDPNWAYFGNTTAETSLAAVHKMLVTLQDRVTGSQSDCLYDFNARLKESFAALESGDDIITCMRTHENLKSKLLELGYNAQIEARTERRYEAKMDYQHKVLYNIMQERESNLNQGIAIDSKKIAESSKRDSSSMKAIAALTMVFLPGTATATIFSMSSFFVRADGELRLASGFWIFWAVTIPLTIVVVTVWLTLSWIWDRSREKKLDEIGFGLKDLVRKG